MKRLVGVLALLACGPTSVGLSADCKDFVDCSYKTGVPPGSLDSRYGAGGWCWKDTTTAASCVAGCKDGNDAFKSSGVGADAGCTFP